MNRECIIVRWSIRRSSIRRRAVEGGRWIRDVNLHSVMLGQVQVGARQTLVSKP